MSELAKYADSFRSMNPEGMYKALRAMDSALDVLYSRTGKQRFQFQDVPATDAQSSLHQIAALAPPAASFSVVGFDGKFEVAIANPQNVLPISVEVMRAQFEAGLNTQQTAIVHNLQSGTDTNFNNASSLKDYGISPVLSYTFQNPYAVLFWRLRSSYDGKTWNAWQIFSSALTCGPVGVSSGALRSTSQFPNPQLNTTNYATVDSIDAGADATIRVYGAGGVGSQWQRQAGATLVGPDGTPKTFFPAASLPHFAYTTKYTVMYDTINGVYGVFTAAQFSQTLPDTYAFVGIVTTIDPGGGGGAGGGGGGGGQSGGGRGFKE